MSKHYEQLLNQREAEIERLRALTKQARDALDQMLTWMPSGFAPQSQADAMEMARNAVKAIDSAYEQSEK